MKADWSVLKFGLRPFLSCPTATEVGFEKAKLVHTDFFFFIIIQFTLTVQIRLPRCSGRWRRINNAHAADFLPLSWHVEYLGSVNARQLVSWAATVDCVDGHADHSTNMFAFLLNVELNLQWWKTVFGLLM